MSLAIEFSTIGEMFHHLTTKFEHETRPLLMVKIDKKYRGVSYKELRQRVEHFAAGLIALGIHKRDHIAIVSENRPEWVIADLAIASIGAVSVPIYPTLTAKQIEYIFNDARIKIAIVSNQAQLTKVKKIRKEVHSLTNIILIAEKKDLLGDKVLGFSDVTERGIAYEKHHRSFLAQKLRETNPDELLTIIYTSGTTGNPKGVMLTHRNLVSNIHAAAEVIPITEEDCLLSFLPLCHSFERMAGYYTAMACGASIAYAESIETVGDNLIEVKPTIVTTVPRLFDRIQSRLRKQIDSSSPAKQKIFYWAVRVGREYVAARRSAIVNPVLKAQYALAEKLVFSKLKERTGGRIKFFVSGGAALPSELGEFFEAVGITILEGYGLTETSPVLSVNRLDDYEFGSVGKPVPGVHLKIATDGEILAKGPNVMLGYYNNRKATEEVVDPDGWFHTGDIGMFGPRGNLVITDRKKHLFVSSGGKNIAPQPIENIFLQSKYIDQFVLIGDRRMFLSALIVPDFNVLQEYADRSSIPYRTVPELVSRPEINTLMENEIQYLQKDLANYERVRKFAILDKSFSMENGEITPTQKIKRKVIETKYAHVIEEMYRNIA